MPFVPLLVLCHGISNHLCPQGLRRRSISRIHLHDIAEKFFVFRRDLLVFYL